MAVIAVGVILGVRSKHQTAATQRDTAASATCAPRLDPARSSSQLPSDLTVLAVDNQLAGLPLPGLAPRSVVSATPIRTPEDLLEISAVADPRARLAALRRDGFDGGVSVDYASGPDDYGVIVSLFSSPASALDYLEVHLADVCRESSDLRVLPGLAGVTFLRDDGVAKAVFAVGDAEVQLDVCGCVGASDQTSLAASWAEAIDRQLSSTTPTAPTVAPTAAPASGQVAPAPGALGSAANPLHQPISFGSEWEPVTISAPEAISPAQLPAIVGETLPPGTSWERIEVTALYANQTTPSENGEPGILALELHLIGSRGETYSSASGCNCHYLVAGNTDPTFPLNQEQTLSHTGVTVNGAVYYQVARDDGDFRVVTESGSYVATP